MIHRKGAKNTVEAIIRVIKKGEIGNVEKPDFINKPPKKDAARRMAETIMNWVTDLKTRKLEETRLAMERFRHT